MLKTIYVSGCSVLVVDDSLVQLQHAINLCQEVGFETIHQATNGREALTLIETLDPPPGLIVTDLEMPEMDGIELVEILRQRGTRIPIILMSACEETLLEAVQGINSSVVSGLHKPLTREMLRQAVMDQGSSDFGASASILVTPATASTAPTVTVEMLAHSIEAGEIVPYFQPKVHSDTMLLRGVEALARWKHPQLGFIPPSVFIELAEREGLILPLTLSIMEQSFAQCAIWLHHGMRLSVAINLSPLLLESRDILKQTQALLVRHGVEPSQVILEITEGHFVDSSGNALSVLARFRLKGFGLSIDDYGTGYSSMQQLLRIPFTELKIDRSFVHDAHRRKATRVVLQSALEVANRLKLSVVAEGVETLEDWRLLRIYGCSTCQGWLFAPAIAGEEIPGWSAANLARLRQLGNPPA